MSSRKSWTKEPGENANALKHTLRVAKLPEIDQCDPQEVGQRIEEYFQICIDDDIRPTVTGLAVALGTDRPTLFRWKTSNKFPSEVIGMVDRAMAILNADQEENIANANNIVGSIFLMKNSFPEYTDKREVVHKVQMPQLTQDELMEKARRLPGFE